MATIGDSFFDLIELYKRQDENRQIATIIELLAETNPILEDAMAVECNMGTKHRTTIRTGLPAVTWGQLYQGIPQSKSDTTQVDDTTGFVEGLSTVDKRLLDISNNPNAVRMTEATAFAESLSQEVATQIIYGNAATDPERFTGLAPRFNDLGAGNGGQIVDAAGTGADNQSVWFVSWGDNQTHLLYPSGTQAGITREDKGEQRVLDGSSNAYYVMEELWRHHIGLTVRDWRYTARIANIETAALIAGTLDPYALLRQAFWKIKRHNLPDVRQVIYCTPDFLEALDADSTPTTGTTPGTNSAVRLTPSEVDGFPVFTYRGVPVRQLDALTITEAQVT